MNTNENLLTTLAEECAEVSKVISKSLRFGLNDRKTLDPKTRSRKGPTNRKRLVEELNDLLGVAELCRARGILPDDWKDLSAQNRKAKKVAAYLEYSKTVGAVTE